MGASGFYKKKLASCHSNSNFFWYKGKNAYN